MVEETNGAYRYIAVGVSRDVAVISLNRPEVLNALSRAMRDEFVQVIRDIDSASRVRGVVITGMGRAFSAGADLTARAHTPGDSRAQVESFHEMTRAILRTHMPVVAAINGLAVGGAAELTFCCDARVGGDGAEFFMPENELGLVISNASSVLLRRLVGNHATRIILASPRVKADEAVRIGLLDKMVSADRLIDEAVDLVREWTPRGGGTAVHVRLLRPTAAEIEIAMERENEAADAMQRTGLTDAGIERFWEQKARKA
jgi:enoyl-CoA hydratase/carnithine racemase